MDLPTKFNYPMFNYLEVIMLTHTNKHIHKQINKDIQSKSSTSLCYVMPVANDLKWTQAIQIT